MSEDLDEMSKDELKEKISKMRAKLNEKERENYPWGKPSNDLTEHIHILRTYFHDEFGEATTKTDNKAINFFVEYLVNELQRTRYTEWTPRREELDNLKDSVRKLLMEAEPDAINGEDNQMIEDWINEEGRFSHDREERMDSGGSQ